MVNAKIAILFHNLGPYHAARIRALKAHFNDIVVIELASREGTRDWKRPDISGVKRITIIEGKYEEIPPKRLINGIKQALDKSGPQCVAVAGYGDPAMRGAAQWARRLGIPTVLFSESQSCDWPRNNIKEYIKRVWIRKYFDAAFASGTNAAAYLQSLGFANERIWRGYSVVDNGYLETQADTVRVDAGPLRARLGLPNKYFLYAGRFSEEKNLSRLLRAYNRYRAEVGEEAWDLVMVGSGPKEMELKAEIEKQQIKGVHWPGFKQINELPQYYALASAFILPSTREPWGLVVNEAMACGLPVLVSSQCGCAADLVNPGINGWVFDPFSEMSITEALTRMSSELTDRKTMGAASKSLVAKYTPETWAQSLSDCASFIMSKRP